MILSGSGRNTDGLLNVTVTPFVMDPEPGVEGENSYITGYEVTDVVEQLLNVVLLGWIRFSLSYLSLWIF